MRIDYSTLNYKDALAITGKGAVVRKFPMVPGIDFAGRVEAFALGDALGDDAIEGGLVRPAHGVGDDRRDWLGAFVSAHLTVDRK